MDPETDLAAFEAWIVIDREVAKLAGLARSRMGAGAADELDRVRGTLAVQAQMYQEGAFEARVRAEQRTPGL
jgi:hypothetical protein